MTQPAKHPVSTYIDDQGREFHYIFINRHQPKFVVHFTAFFGDWGDRKEYKTYYQGYFHRLRMLGSEPEFSALFLCDQFGFTKNGTYYLGEKGDLFVERAMNHIIEKCFREADVAPEQTIMVGSSMGATGAMKFGLLYNVKGIISLSPHIDLDTCAAKQGREPHVAFTLADGKVYAEHNRPITRKIESLIQNWPKNKKLPRLFVHSCTDDYGVHAEQVVPKNQMWRERGGWVEMDERPVGGHGSQYATKAITLDVISNIFAGKESPLKEYRTRWKYKPENEQTFEYYLRKALKPVKFIVKPILKPILDSLRAKK